MDVVDSLPVTTEPVGREMTRAEIFVSRAKYWLLRQRRRLPYLVWYNDELDVTVTLSQDKLDPENPLASFSMGAFSEIQTQFSALGISFDSGMGPEGRDWEWDWSLKGPISIRFRGRASKPELRMERPKPQLIFSRS